MFSGKSKPGCPYRKTELLEEFKDKALVSGFVCSVLRLPLPKVHSIACECMLLVAIYYFVIACVVTVPFSSLRFGESFPVCFFLCYFKQRSAYMHQIHSWVKDQHTATSRQKCWIRFASGLDQLGSVGQKRAG